ncbi:hypothetical protein LCGC14_0982930 [marine sediment metagenome]|uniref:Uncharacterized protein n=1 Tax=marine sediment metagenome TaxID=412755 RepID=A0A0F9N821_9ZZZZ
MKLLWIVILIGFSKNPSTDFVEDRCLLEDGDTRIEITHENLRNNRTKAVYKTTTVRCILNVPETKKEN